MSRGKKRIGLLVTVCVVLGLLTGAGAVQNFIQDAAEPVKIFTDVLAIVHTKYVEEVSVRDLVYRALEGMLMNLDPHSAFMRPDDMRELSIDTKGKFEGLGIEISLRDNYILIISPFDGSPAAKAGLMPGDYIVKIEGQSTRGMNLMDAVKKLRGPAGTTVKIQVWRKSWAEPKDFEITRASITVQTVQQKVLEKGYGYIKLTQFNQGSSDDLRRALQELRKQEGGIQGLVLDLRNNPGGLLDQAIGVADLFVDEGLIVFTRGRGKQQEFSAAATKGNDYPDFPLVVLINAGSASASEIVAGCLQDLHRAVLIGERSFGKGSVQTIIPLGDGSGLRLTMAKYYTPAGRDIQAKGIEPDLLVLGDPLAGLSENRRKMIREADLDRHLQGGDDAPPVTVPEGPAVPPDDEPKDKGSDDPQLDTALRVLKAWPAFQKAAKP
jgi:carboxyl-terminal processing protease